MQERLDDLQTRLQRERNSWRLQETLYNERLKVFQDIQEVYRNCLSYTKQFTILIPSGV